jgi:prevent-host-death family protein
MNDDMGLHVPDFTENTASPRLPRRIAKLTSREFNQDVGKAKRAAEKAPVVITDRGKPAFVLMKHAEYQRLLGKRPGLSELLNDEATKDLEFEPARIQNGWLRPADLD